MDEEAYIRIRGLMRMSVLKVWPKNHVIAGMDPWTVVDEAWSSMAEGGFRSAGPFLPFALRVAKNKALDALTRSEARRRDRSLEEPLSASDGSLVLGDTVAGSVGADADYFMEVERVEEIQRLTLAEQAIYSDAVTRNEREVFLAVVRDGKSRAAVGRELDPPVTGQRVGQIVAAATSKIRAYIEQHDQGEWRREDERV